MEARSMDMTHRRPHRANGEHYELITAHQVLTLAEALQQWCDARLVLQVMEWEPKCSASEVERLRRVQLTHRAFRRPATQENADGDPYFRLLAAWNDLELDLLRRVEGGLIYLRGVRLGPQRHITPEIIPGAWAAEFQFDFSRGMITAGEFRFGSVACSLDPWTPEPPQVAEPASVALNSPQAAVPIAEMLAELRPEDFPTLSDEMVLALLEEHARRVIKNDGKLMAANKVSWLQIVRGKMQHRATSDVMRDSLAAESEWLAAWIAERVKLHQAPVAATIRRWLNDDYKQLKKARSTPAMRKEEF